MTMLPLQYATQYYSWGRICHAVHRGIYRPNWADELGRFDSTDAPLLAFGLGRSYGDSCLNDGGYLIDTSSMDHVMSFEMATGRIRCAAGVSLGTILEVAVPRGWFLPVTPGTKFVTVGGAIANDVHGKNHHCAGTFGCHVLQFELLRSDGTRMLCSPVENADWYAATIGGLGLTGIILSAEIQLRKIKSNKIGVNSTPFRSLGEFLELTERAEEAGSEYTVAWIDCLATPDLRGIFFSGDHEDSGELELPKLSRRGLRIPFALPAFVLNRLTVKGFNAFYYGMKGRKSHTHNVGYDEFFYPLDAVADWNLIYGKRGLVQYQCVIPESESAAFEELLRRISLSGEGSFLGVMKKFGDKLSPGLMSFPRPGFTLALDFAFRGVRTLRLFEQLDAIVLQANGALYPAKDGRMSGRMFRASYPNLQEFRRYVDPHLSSGFWRRVQGEEAL